MFRLRQDAYHLNRRSFLINVWYAENRLRKWFIGGVHINMRIEVPEKAEKIIDALQEQGYDAYVVGGCVRDSLLRRSPADWDITTSATPEEVKRIFRRTVDTGIQHGTVTVLMDKEGFEVTTYRIDGEYEDGRHPKEVTFTPSLEEDLKRRDFTINAMAYNHRKGLVDIFGGEEDLKNKVVRCVGNPRERFTEDALRILRAVRFSAQLGFSIEEKTQDAARDLGETLKKISAERIQTELVKLLVSPNPQYLRKAWELGLTRIFLPEFDKAMETPQKNPHHCYSVGEHTLKAMEAVRPDRTLRLTLLFHDLGKGETRMRDEKGIDHFYGHPAKSEKIAKSVLKRLRFDNDTINTVGKLVYWHECPWEASPSSVRRALSKTGIELFPLLLEVRKADIIAQSSYRRTEKMEWLEKLQEIYQDILRRQECVSIRSLAVSGKDLIDAGMKPGREIGETLNGFLEIVLENPEKNTKEYLLSLL